MPRHIVLALALLLPLTSALAADRYTCRVLEKLMQTTDKGLDAVAAGKANRQPASGIATYAEQSLDMAQQFSTKDPLPKEIVAALSAMAEAATANFSITDAAPALLKHGLVVWQAMPKICPGTIVPNLARHK